MIQKLSQFPQMRLRRLRQNQVLRDLTADTSLHVEDLILPLFIHAGIDQSKPILSMPDHYQLSLAGLKPVIKRIQQNGIKTLLLFGIPKTKDAFGNSASKADGIIQSSIQAIKQIAPELVLIADCCFCEYTTHGHCGVITENETVDNDATLLLLAEQAVSLARAGADIIAPSGMMDGMVACLRTALDAAAFTHIPIFSYAVKYASALYTPFREAAEGAPQFGDRKTYQMDYRRKQEAVDEVGLDLKEGADCLIIKPATFYLDIIHKINVAYPSAPIIGYQVSGEYAMIKAAADKGWLDETPVMLESLIAIKRAGASAIITYFALDAAKFLHNHG